MRELTPVNEIHVPEPKPDEAYTLKLPDRDLRFRGLKALLGAADYSKAGDRQAGLAAPADDVREAARSILSDLTLEHLYERPLTDDQGRVDSVMRVSYDIDRDVFASIASLTLGELKDRLLQASGLRNLANRPRTHRRDGSGAGEIVRRARVDPRGSQDQPSDAGANASWSTRALSRRDCSRIIPPTTPRESRSCVIGVSRWGPATRFSASIRPSTRWKMSIGC